MILFMQSYLMDAGMSRIAQQSSIGNLKGNMHILLCAPHQHQFKYCNKLCSIGAAKISMETNWYYNIYKPGTANIIQIYSTKLYRCTLTVEPCSVGNFVIEQFCILAMYTILFTCKTTLFFSSLVVKLFQIANNSKPSICNLSQLFF